MRIIIGAAPRIQIVGSDAVVGGHTFTVDGLMLYGKLADRPTVAQAQTALGVTYPQFFDVDTSTAYIADSSGAWRTM